MITGDNPLTACHVAKELKFTQKKTTLVLTKIENLSENDEKFEWQSIDQVNFLIKISDLQFTNEESFVKFCRQETTDHDCASIGR